MIRRDPEWAGVFSIGRLRVLLKFMHWRHMRTWRVLRFGWQRGDGLYLHSVIDLPFIELSWGATPGWEAVRLRTREWRVKLTNSL